MAELPQILTGEEMEARYQELGDYKWPYVIEVHKDDQVLYFIGARHSYDPSDQQRPAIEGKWQEFIHQTQGNGRIAMYEGGARKPANTPEAAILANGESGLICYLAGRASIEAYSPEPDRKSEIDFLLESFSKDDIMYYYFARQVLQWLTLKDQPDFEAYIALTLEGYAGVAKWPEYDFSLEHMKQLFEDSNNRPFSLDDKKPFYNSSAPASSEVSEASGRYRDRHILGEIVHHWTEGKSIFAVFGSGHALVLEPALKTLRSQQL